MKKDKAFFLQEWITDNGKSVFMPYFPYVEGSPPEKTKKEKEEDMKEWLDAFKSAK